jgi:hypothetical protein
MIQPARRQAAMPIKPGTPPDMVAMKVVLVDCLIYRGLPRSGGDTPHHHQTVTYPLQTG